MKWCCYIIRSTANLKYIDLLIVAFVWRSDLPDSDLSFVETGQKAIGKNFFSPIFFRHFRFDFPPISREGALWRGSQEKKILLVPKNSAWGPRAFSTPNFAPPITPVPLGLQGCASQEKQALVPSVGGSTPGRSGKYFLRTRAPNAILAAAGAVLV